MTAATHTADAELLEYRFRWSAAEHRAFYRVLQREVVRRGMLRFLVPVGLMVFVVVALVAIVGSTLPAATVLITLAPYILLFLMWIALLKWALPYMSARSYERTHKACIAHDQIRAISGDGIEARCVTSTVHVHWSGIVRAVETADFFLFFTTPSCAIQLPKLAVGEGAELDRLRTALRARLGARAELAGAESMTATA